MKYKQKRTPEQILAALDTLRDKRQTKGIHETTYRQHHDALWEELRAADRAAAEAKNEIAERAKERRRDRLMLATKGYESIKAAIADGYAEEKSEFYDGEKLVLSNHRLTKGHKIAVSATEWKRRGYRVRPDETPHARLHHSVGSGAKMVAYSVYREDQVESVVLRPKQFVFEIPKLLEELFASS